MRILILLALASCVPKTAAEQAKYAADHEGSNGTLDGSLQPVGERGATSFSPMDKKVMTLHHASDGEICLRKDFGQRLTFDPKEVVRERWETYAAKTTVVVGAHDSLATFSGWPDRKTGVPGRITGAKVSRHLFNDNQEESYWLEGDVEWCAPVPAISSTTKFITATKWVPKEDHPLLFVWNIKGTPTPTGGTGPADPVSEPTASTEPTSDPSAPAAEAPAGSITEALRKDGRFRTFLKVVTAAGKEQELASGSLTVLAPHDSTFERTWKTSKELKVLLADKARCLAIYKNHVAKGVIAKKTVQSSKDVVVTTASGKTYHLTFDTGYALDGEQVESTVLEAEHAVAYVVQSVHE